MTRCSKCILRWKWCHSCLPVRRNPASFVFVLAAVLAAFTSQTYSVTSAFPATLARQELMLYGGQRRTWYIHDGFCGCGFFLVRVRTRHLICEEQRARCVSQRFSSPTYCITRYKRRAAASFPAFIAPPRGSRHIFTFSLWLAGIAKHPHKRLRKTLFVSEQNRCGWNLRLASQ